MPDRPFDFIPLNTRPPKPRTRGMTEIRGSYYTVVGRGYLRDLLEAFGQYVDGLKYAGGSFALMERRRIIEVNDLAREHGVYVSTGGWIEQVLTFGRDAVRQYIRECKELGFDVLEISTGFISLPADDLLRLVEQVRDAGLKPKPELGIQFGAGGATSPEELSAEGVRDAGWVIDRARRCFDAGAEIIMIESEGITESVQTWRTDVVGSIVSALGSERVMFEAADPPVFEWYIKTFGADVNLFVDHSQIVQLECLRSGVWGTKSSWGRVRTYGEADQR